MKVCLLILTMSFSLTAYSGEIRLGQVADAAVQLHEDIAFYLKIQHILMIMAEQESVELQHLAESWPDFLGPHVPGALLENPMFTQVDTNVAILAGTVRASINNGYLIPPLEQFDHPLFQRDYVFTAIITRNLNGGIDITARFTKVPYNF